MTRQAIPLHRGTYDPQFPPVDPRIVAVRLNGPARYYRITVGIAYLISMVLA